MILLDTHALLWLVIEPERLSRAAASSIRRVRARGSIGIADTTLLELAFCSRGERCSHREPLENALHEIVQSTGVLVRPITAEIAALAAQFPEDYPRDPADRLIGAAAGAEAIPLITRDERIRRSPWVKTVCKHQGTVSPFSPF